MVTSETEVLAIGRGARSTACMRQVGTANGDAHVVEYRDLIPSEHPIRRIRRIVDEVLGELDGEFDAMYSRVGRPSIPPEQLLKATILMAMTAARPCSGRDQPPHRSLSPPRTAATRSAPC
ncbi:MAG TPA: hypothetical protein VM143_07680 [Acidimicrobiales bacterium]|nr:hypothetical protein [Acidimicrobiales bacterium]